MLVTVYPSYLFLVKPFADALVIIDLLQGMLNLAAQFAMATPGVSYLGALFAAVQPLISDKGLCDGVVVADVIRSTSTMLQNLATNEFQTTIIYPSLPSPAGCGSNSNYILAIYGKLVSAVSSPSPVSTVSESDSREERLMNSVLGCVNCASHSNNNAAPKQPSQYHPYQHGRLYERHLDRYGYRLYCHHYVRDQRHVRSAFLVYNVFDLEHSCVSYNGSRFSRIRYSYGCINIVIVLSSEERGRLITS